MSTNPATSRAAPPSTLTATDPPRDGRNDARSPCKVRREWGKQLPRPFSPASIGVEAPDRAGRATRGHRSRQSSQAEQPCWAFDPGEGASRRPHGATERRHRGAGWVSPTTDSGVAPGRFTSLTTSGARRDRCDGSSMTRSQAFLSQRSRALSPRRASARSASHSAGRRSLVTSVAFRAVSPEDRRLPGGSVSSDHSRPETIATPAGRRWPPAWTAFLLGSPIQSG